MAEARRRRAIETVKRRLCFMMRRVQVLEECKYDVGCYIDVLLGKKKFQLVDCKDPAQKPLPKPGLDWRQREKAAYMLALLAKKQRREDAIRALCTAYKDATVSVRKAILRALDHLADRRHADRPDMGKKILDVVEQETFNRRKGVWQINRDARACIGRMKRRKPWN